jgi:hypothetical protein
MENHRNKTPKNLHWLPAVFASWLALLLYLGLLTLAEAVVEPVIPCLPETDMVINYEDLVDCSIDFNGDSDLFRFAGQDGETVLIQVSELVGTGDACIDLFRPDGSSKASSCAANRIDTTLDQTGTHTIVVSENSNDETVSYRLALMRLVPPSPTALPIQFNSFLDNEINPPADVDVFLTGGNSGDTIRIEVVELAGTGDACIDLFRPDGSSTASSCAANRIDTTLDQTGTHTIVVSENSNDETVSYRLTLQCIAGICAPFNPPPTLSLTLTGCTTCRAGDPFIVQAHLTNAGSRDVLVEVKIGVRLPDGTSVNLLGNKHLEFPFSVGLNSTVPLFNLPLPGGLPIGAWTLEGTLLGPDLGETLSRDVKPFTVVP